MSIETDPGWRRCSRNYSQEEQDDRGVESLSDLNQLDHKGVCPRDDCYGSTWKSTGEVICTECHSVISEISFNSITCDSSFGGASEESHRCGRGLRPGHHSHNEAGSIGSSPENPHPSTVEDGFGTQNQYIRSERYNSGYTKLYGGHQDAYLCNGDEESYCINEMDVKDDPNHLSLNFDTTSGWVSATV